MKHQAISGQLPDDCSTWSGGHWSEYYTAEWIERSLRTHHDLICVAEGDAL